MLFGLVLFIGSFILLGWNENNYVERYKALKEGQGNTVSVTSDSVDASNEGKLIHTTGLADTKEELSDAAFKFSKVAIHLDRKVETYQWVERVETEKKKELGGSEKTIKTYYYDKKWSATKHKSSEFGDPDARSNKTNPTVWKHDAQNVSADNVALGAFTLTPALISSVKKSEKVVLTDENRPDDTYKVADGMVYSGNPAEPKIGDQRVTLSITPPSVISLVSQQKGNSFTPYIAKNGRKLSELRMGEHTMEAMYSMAHSDNNMMTWILRGVGFFIMFLGLSLFFKPLSVLADVVPFIGSLVGAGVGIICFLLALVLSSLTIAIAWVVVRPLVGIPLLIIAGVATFFIGKKMKAAKAATPTPAES